jgi:hypothetical protein
MSAMQPIVEVRKDNQWTLCVKAIFFSFWLHIVGDSYAMNECNQLSMANTQMNLINNRMTNLHN